MPKPVIAIKIPTLGDVNAGILAFVNALRSMEAMPYEFTVDVILGYRPHDYARNRCVLDIFEKSEIERLWFIDADVVPNPRSVRLLMHDADIVVGPYCVTKREDGILRPQSSMYRRTGEREWTAVDTDEAGILEVDGAGMGMMLIKREVLTDPRMWLGNDHSAYVGKKPNLERILFRHTYNPDGSLALGEDMDFCRRARDHGYRIIADTSCRVGHVKEIDLEEFRKALAAVTVFA